MHKRKFRFSFLIAVLLAVTLTGCGQPKLDPAQQVAVSFFRLTVFEPASQHLDELRSLTTASYFPTVAKFAYSKKSAKAKDIPLLVATGPQPKSDSFETVWIYSPVEFNEIRLTNDGSGWKVDSSLGHADADYYYAEAKRTFPDLKWIEVKAQ